MKHLFSSATPLPGHKTLALILLIICTAALYAVAPVVTNSTAAQRTDGSKLVDIYFDVSCTSDDSVYINLSLSSDGGATFSIIPNSANLSGDIGRIHIGTANHIIWNAGAETQNFDGNQFACKVQAWDMQPMPANFIFVQGGTFNNGTSDVTLSSFYMDKYELTQAAYQAIMGTWNSDPYGWGSAGVGASNPVYYVSWFNAIEYCNRRSIAEGITPCYSYLTYGTNPATWPTGWNITATNHVNVACNWTATGYRMPSESEWQYAALGGNQTHNYTYSGSNTIDGVAWYSSNSGSTTHTVGTKTANELGLSDMSGNVWEWNWDIYGTYPGGAQTNPHGVVSGSYRVGRGGGWVDVAYDCPVSGRGIYNATYSNYHIGFRCVRVSP